MPTLTRKFSEAQQGTDEWLADRIGYVTASNIAAVMAKGRNGAPSATRRNYMVKLVCEMLSGKSVAGYKSSNMQDGNDNEATARLAYELQTGSTVTEAGFCYIDQMGLGASTDGLVESTDGLVEIKNVIPAEQIDFWDGKKIKREYMLQMQTQMFVLDKQWVDFVSQSLGDEFYGELPENLKLKTVRVQRDEAMIKDILAAVKQFNRELLQLRKKLELIGGKNG